MSFWKQLRIAGSVAVLTLFWWFMANIVHAASPDAFLVEVSPSSFDVNQAVDITIKAVKANGEIVKDYQWDVFIEVKGIVDAADFTVPSDGLYTFTAQDQWVRLFSKGLSIKKSWTFTIKVSDFPDDSIMGEKTIIVGSNQSASAAEGITIISPVAGGIEKNSIANVMASATSLPNAPYEIYINSNVVSEGMTNANGDISAYVSGIKAGDNILQIKILNASNEVIGESETTSFTYQPIKDGVFTSIKITPNGKINQWQKASFTVNTSDSVTSAQIKIGDNKAVPLDKKSAGVFTKDILIEKEWLQQVDVNLIVLGQTKSDTGVASIFGEKGNAIGKIRLYSDSIDKTKLNVTRESIGTTPQYKISYGTSQNNLDLSVVVQTNEIIIENLNVGDVYYFQITPLDESWNPIGTASDITQAKIWEEASCVVVGITVTGQKIWDKYYLVRSGVTNVEKYVIYRAEFETSEIANMQKVGETTGTMFEYPFNKFAKKDQYAYYLVEAICKDGTSLKVDNVKKIHVWPVENILLIILISLFGYTIYKLYEFSKN